MHKNIFKYPKSILTRIFKENRIPESFINTTHIQREKIKGKPFSLYVFDIDDTTINKRKYSNKGFATSIIEAILLLRNSKTILTFNTARPPDEFLKLIPTEYLAAILPPNVPVALELGGRHVTVHIESLNNVHLHNVSYKPITDTQKDKINQILSNLFEYSNEMGILYAPKDPNLNQKLILFDNSFYNKISEKSKIYNTEVDTNIDKVLITGNQYQSKLLRFLLEEDNPCLVRIFGEKNLIKDIYEKYKDKSMVIDGDGIRITPPGLNKNTALNVISKRAKVPLQKTTVAGDSKDADGPMFENTKLKNRLSVGNNAELANYLDLMKISHSHFQDPEQLGLHIIETLKQEAKKENYAEFKQLYTRIKKLMNLNL